ncbi:hypothetical protein H5410_016465 [Solanum commersonii]|uniref:Uncharacterized protein n=1 Tax=Solanum commersonii TaxID=4109 RepID=A0A9J5ZWJ7_SOLCO|nr:hypothetical protein H5410_016465 [Solanum commersonii]
MKKIFVNLQFSLICNVKEKCVPMYCDVHHFYRRKLEQPPHSPLQISQIEKNFILLNHVSNHDVPDSPSLESLGEQIFGQQSISKRNDKSLGKETSDFRWADLVEEKKNIFLPLQGIS